MNLDKHTAESLAKYHKCKVIATDFRTNRIKGEVTTIHLKRDVIEVLDDKTDKITAYYSACIVPLLYKIDESYTKGSTLDQLLTEQIGAESDSTPPTGYRSIHDGRPCEVKINE